MSENHEIFKKLLPIDELFELYCKIGETILSRIDIENINEDRQSKSNSIQLLMDLFFIAYDSDTKLYYKKISNPSKVSFATELFEMLLANYPDAFSFVNTVDIRYDEVKAKYYTKRNFIDLNLSGLLMLLDGIGIIQFVDNFIYFVDTRILTKGLIICKKTQRKTNLTELKDQLALQEQFGNDAEVMAIEFEKNFLLHNNIFKSPERVSLYDVAAGYDIVSYMTRDSEVPDKFIEVKSCSDDSLQFYISRNEIEIAKTKRNQYYLYLYNRRTGEFTIIHDPYTTLFDKNNGSWAIEPQAYKIHLLGD